MVVALETVKQYLRVDTADDDTLIFGIVQSAEEICRDILRVTPEESLTDIPEIEIAVLYATAYLYEHREEADHHALIISLRYLLGGGRKEAF